MKFAIQFELKLMSTSETTSQKLALISKLNLLFFKKILLSTNFQLLFIHLQSQSHMYLYLFNL